MKKGPTPQDFAGRPLSAILREVGTPAGDRRVTDVLAAQPYPHYQAALDAPDPLVRESEDGTRTVVRKWGSSLALRIPDAMAAEARIESGTEVEIALMNGRLMIHPITSHPSLADLLSAITPGNTHAESVTGRGVGAEAW